MPRFDGKGPEGKGSQTGRGMGKCGSNSTENEKTEPTIIGRGFGRRGRGASRCGRGNAL